MTSVEFTPSRRQILAGGAGLGMIALLAACSTGSSAGGSAVSTAQLIVAWPNDADSLDPQNSSYSFQDWDLFCNLYETLVSPKFVSNGAGVMVWDGLELAPELADSYTVKGDTATFYLNKTRKFYPSGNPLTADDVIYTMQRLFALKQQSSLNTAGIFSMNQMKKIDDHTVEMKFTDSNGHPIEVNGFQLAVFRWPNLAILDSVEVRKHVTSGDPTGTNWLKNNAAGTGPYYVKSRTIGQQIELAAVPGNPRNPAYKNVTIQVVGNVASLLEGGSAPTILSAANEAAVAAFLERRIGFLKIARTVERVLDAMPARMPVDLDDVVAIDREARDRALRFIGNSAPAERAAASG